jgi:hypothetical protein
MNWGFISQKMAFFIVTAVKTSNLTERDLVSEKPHFIVFKIPDDGQCPRTH